MDYTKLSQIVDSSNNQSNAPKQLSDSLKKVLSRMKKVRDSRIKVHDSHKSPKYTFKPQVKDNQTTSKVKDEQSKESAIKEMVKKLLTKGKATCPVTGEWTLEDKQYLYHNGAAVKKVSPSVETATKEITDIISKA